MFFSKMRRYLLPITLLLALVVQPLIVLADTGAPARARLAPPAVSQPVADALDRLTEVSGRPPMQTTHIYDRYGNLLYELSDEGRRTIIALEQVPKLLRDATVATEDKNFYVHGGVDLSAVARAAYQNWQADDIVSGASTIPQQLVRTLLMSDAERHELTMNRKVREASLAVELDNKYSKDQILEMYLNSVYYGHQAYGVAAAAETYLRKNVSDLTLAESALLAGLPQSPARYDPFVDPQAAFARQRVVLDLMEAQGYISAADKEAALAERIRLIPPPLPVLRAPHFVDYVRGLLMERYGSEGMRQGLEVHTSIDLRYQQLVERIARAQIATIGPKAGASNAAVVLIHPPTGQMLAMAGSLDYYDETIDGQVNMATALRQPGSSIKPVLYAAAFDNGWTPASVIWDLPVVYPLGRGAYVPHNVTGLNYGIVRLRTALANSLNIPAIRLLHDLGVPRMLETGERMGIHAWRAPAEAYGLSLAVGGYEVPLVELTHAFATLANNGAFSPLSPITAIRDGAGRVLFQAQPPNPPQYAVSPVAAYQVTSVISDARTRQMIFGARSALDTSQPTAVKTGTTDNYRDNLTVGYTPYLAVGVWVGNSDGRPLKNSVAYQSAAPLWHDIFETIWATPSLHPALGYVSQPLPQGFTPPPGILRTPVCELLAGKFTRTCPRAYEEVFAAPAQPLSDTVALPQADAQTSGYCLPLLQADLPASLYKTARFLPYPTTSQDRSAMHNWAEGHNLPRTTLAECDPTPTQREIAAPPPLPAPSYLVFVPPLKPQAGGIIEGGRVALNEKVQGLNIRTAPGAQQTILGSLKPGQIAVIRQGPQEADGEQWFQIRILDNNLTGWVVSRFLRALPPPDQDAAIVNSSPNGAATP